MSPNRSVTVFATVVAAWVWSLAPAHGQDNRSNGLLRDAATASLGAIAATGIQYSIAQLDEPGQEYIPYTTLSGAGAAIGYRLGAGGSFRPGDLRSDRREVVGSLIGAVLATAVVSRTTGGHERGVDLPYQLLVSVAQGTGSALLARLLR